MNKFLIYSARFGFLALIGFETLNWAGVLSFTLDFSWLGLIGTAFLVWLALEIYHYFYESLSGFVYFAGLIGVTLDAFSDIFGFYSQIMWWDRCMHFTEGVIAAILIIAIFKKSAFHTILLVSFLGFLYEFWEFLIDKFYFGFSMALGDGPDTVEDMFLNIAGAAFIILAVKITQKFIKK